MAASFVIWALAAARLWAILWVQVLWRTAVPAWGLVGAGLAGLVATLVERPGTELPISLGHLVAAVGLELLLGFAIGLVATLPGYALVGAMSASAVVLRAPPRLLVGLGVAVALATALGIGLHRPLVSALLETFTIFHLGDAPAWVHRTAVSGLASLLRAAHAALVLALALATPVLLTAAIAELMTGLVSRGPGPAHAAVSPLRPWLRVAGGLVALGASWGAYGHVWAEAVVPR